MIFLKICYVIKKLIKVLYRLKLFKIKPFNGFDYELIGKFQSKCMPISTVCLKAA